jgi:uncharacterized damage-inducible protein DinB
MIPYAGPQLAAAFRTVRNNTIQIAEEIPEEHYGFRAAPATRTVAQMLIHLVQAPRFAYRVHAELKLASLEGFDFMGLVREAVAAEQNPPSKAEILEQLRSGGDALAQWLEGLTPEFLSQMVSPPPVVPDPPKSRFEMLLGVKEHEMHHRGQLMLMQRMLGLVPHLTRRREALMAQAMQQQAARP